MGSSWEFQCVSVQHVPGWTTLHENFRASFPMIQLLQFSILSWNCSRLVQKFQPSTCTHAIQAHTTDIPFQQIISKSPDKTQGLPLYSECHGIFSTLLDFSLSELTDQPQLKGFIFAEVSFLLLFLTTSKRLYLPQNKKLET